MEGIALTFAGEAYELYQQAVRELTSAVQLFVQVTEAESGEQFDAWLFGVDYDAEMGDTVKVVRNNDGGASSVTWSDLGPVGVESVRADRVHIY